MSLQSDLGDLILRDIPPEYNNNVKFSNFAVAPPAPTNYHPRREFQFDNGQPLRIDSAVKVDYQFDQNGVTKSNSILVLYVGSGA
jgi:hypothetical protein